MNFDGLTLENLFICSTQVVRNGKWQKEGNLGLINSRREFVMVVVVSVMAAGVIVVLVS